MIPYDEFKALPVAERDAICAEKMGWHCGADFFGFDGWIDSCGKFIAYAVSDGETHSWSPTTDRNDAAMMVEKVKDEGFGEQFYFDAALAVVTDMDDVMWCDIILLDPCLIAWAVCVALEEV